MKRSFRLGLLATAFTALCVLPIHTSAQAQKPPAGRGDRPVEHAADEGLSAQEREIFTWAQELSKRCGQVMEKWLIANEVTEDKLFAFLYYPIPKTDPPKFNTEYDKLADRDIQPIEEIFINKSSAIIFAILTDRNGYVPSHNLRYSQPLTGNNATDLVNNRTKRIFSDRTGLTAARNDDPRLVQKYKRDTGEILTDLSVPVFVKGKRWGAIRIGFRTVE
jgi:hypothetical protein